MEKAKAETDSIPTPEETPIDSSRRRYNVLSCVLLFSLYIIQGFIWGYFYAIKLILMEKGASYSQLSLMSLISLPFSFKWLMSPIVDTYFSESFGKRKSFIVPTQYLVSGLLFLLSYHIESLIANNEIVYLVVIFFTIDFCIAF